MIEGGLNRRFERLFNRSAFTTYDDLVSRYGESHRRYHTLGHIEACLAWLDRAPRCGDDRTIELALWWHDAIYDPVSSGNEDASAELASDALAVLGESAPTRAEVARLIRLTAGHRVAEQDIAGARLVAVDLSILGAEPYDYDAYVDQVRAEYSYVPDGAWRTGRARVMAAFLEGPVYADPWFEARLGAQARENIEREIAALAS